MINILIGIIGKLQRSVVSTLIMKLFLSKVTVHKKSTSCLFILFVTEQA